MLNNLSCWLNCIWKMRSECCTSLFWVPLNAQILGQTLRQRCCHGPARAVLQGNRKTGNGAFVHVAVCLFTWQFVCLPWSRLALLGVAEKAHLIDPYSSACGAHAPKVGHAAPAVVERHIAADKQTQRHEPLCFEKGSMLHLDGRKLKLNNVSID